MPKPIRPMISRITKSITSPPTAYAPTAAKNMIPAYRYGRGMRSSFAHTGASGRLSASSSTMPTNREAIRPHTRSGSRSKSSGPGWMPYCWKAASMTAATAVVGRPRVSIDTRVPAAEADAADSGPATPSMAPLPHSSLCLDRRFSVTYDRKVGISAPPAGIAPNGKPMNGPRSHDFQVRFTSPRPSHGRPTGIGSGGLRRRCAATHRASPIAKRPTATITTSMPSASWSEPKVRRCWPVIWSRPTRPRVRPMSREARPRMREEPSTDVTAMNASTMMAK